MLCCCGDTVWTIWCNTFLSHCMLCNSWSLCSAAKAWLAEVTLSLKKSENACIGFLTSYQWCRCEDSRTLAMSSRIMMTTCNWASGKVAKAFRSATTQMSTMKHPMLSLAHAIFRGLQESPRGDLAKLPHLAPREICHASMNHAHGLFWHFLLWPPVKRETIDEVLDPGVRREKWASMCALVRLRGYFPSDRTLNNALLVHWK